MLQREKRPVEPKKSRPQLAPWPDRFSGDLAFSNYSQVPQPSLKAHLKMGFEVVGTYHDGKELWNVVVWDLENVAAGS